MHIEKGLVKVETSRDLFWARIILSLPTGKKSQVLTCASEEYIRATFNLGWGSDISEKTKDDWLNAVIEKWSVLGNEILLQDVHYDVYTTTQEGEQAGLEFLLGILN